MSQQTRRSWQYRLAAIAASLLGWATGCYVGIANYNAEAQRIRAQSGGFVDGRIPLEVPVYAVVGAVLSWMAFRVAAAWWSQRHRSLGEDS